MNEPETDLFIDTNVFVKLFTADKSPEHKETTNFFRLLERENTTFYTSIIVLNELYFLLKKFFQLPKNQIVTIFLQLVKNKQLSIIEQHDVLFALNLFSRHKVSFVDCLIGSIKAVRTGKMIVVSYDKDFDKIHIKRTTPASLVNTILKRR